MRRKITALLGLIPLSAFCVLAYADEGMWTLDNFPKEEVKKKYGFAPDDEWLKKVQLSSARLAGGCSASFVSSDGLVMTNHHCAHSCIEDLSSASQNYIAEGFYAKTQSEERQCPGFELNRLEEITDVTERIAKATRGLSGQKYNDALKKETANIEKECAKSEKLRCDVVNLYHGGLYHLYKYRRFQDVRLVFAPELAIAFFGGDPDNFNFPRYALDVAFLRVYEDGKPVSVEHFFPWSKAGAKEGELTFVSGHPGRTERLLTMAQLAYQRDVSLPDRLLYLAEYRGFLSEFGRRGEEEKRTSESELFYTENSYKALKGRYKALLDEEFFGQKEAEEKALREKVEADPDVKKKYGDAWKEIEKALEEGKKIRTSYIYIEGGLGFETQYFNIARTLVRGATEITKPNEKRLPEFTDARLPRVKQQLLKEVPIYDQFEIAKLTFSLTKLREDLGSDHPFVKKVLGKESPEEMAERLVKGTKLKDAAVRKQLWEGGKKAIDASKDPMIELVKSIDAEARALRKQYEDQVEAVIKKNEEKIAQARFAIYGTNTYPDATFTLRLSYGKVAGFEEKGRKIAPFTYLGGVFDRATGREPFKLPQSWLSAKSRLNPKVPFNFTTTHDIIGGNSGSPVLNKNAEIVGLIFDGNIHSLGGAYGFDESLNRAVSVHSEVIIHALEKIYGAQRLVEELRPRK